ncbi:diguanylate cyclase domain-containing protein [Roseateles sp.]|uniref:diguanylate cyclase domain-containing protein n=1 Tax=Roseateles sp. TaxID=1971397 RepID=UPI003D0FD224
MAANLRPARLGLPQTPPPAAAAPVSELPAHALLKAGAVLAARGRDGVAVQDWELLFTAVKHRLQSLDGADRPPGQAPDACVADCVEALDQLQQTLRHELERRGRLEQDAEQALGDLQQVRQELDHAHQAARQAQVLARRDSLTGLPNRRCFRERLSLTLRQLDRALPAATQTCKETGLAVLFLDLDGFKAINDVLGHAAGDELLKIVALRQARALRSGDLVARWGGDEFACLRTEGLGREALERLARKLFDAVSAPVQLQGQLVQMRPSIGIACWPADGRSAEALLLQADRAMYQAKRLQCGSVFAADLCDSAPSEDGGGGMLGGSEK